MMRSAYITKFRVNFGFANPNFKGANPFFAMTTPSMRFLGFFLFRLLPLFLLATPSTSFSASSNFGIRRDGTLDQSALANAYMESDWELVTTTLEGYLREHGDSRVSPEERIFAYKYLGVIYAADSLFRSKSESYFTRLLNLSPKVEIVDLFASKKVNDFFQSVKREREDRLKYTEQFDSYGRETGKNQLGKGSGTTSSQHKSPGDSMSTFAAKQPLPKPVQVKNTQRKASVKSKKTAWVWWTVGVAAAAGAGAGAYYLALQDPGTRVEKAPEINPK